MYRLTYLSKQQRRSVTKQSKYLLNYYLHSIFRFCVYKKSFINFIPVSVFIFNLLSIDFLIFWNLNFNVRKVL